MRSRRLPQRLTLRPDARAAALLVLLLGVGLGACTPRPAPAPPTRQPEKPPELALARQERAYLVAPLEGYPQEVDPSRVESLGRGHRALLAGDLDAARSAASDLLDVDPTFAPAHVLAAQADFAEGRQQEVVSRLLPLGEQMPGYVASQLLLGRAAERVGDISQAYTAYRAIATRNQLAFQRLGELHPRAIEIVANRLREALRTGQIDEADRHLALLRSWGPSEIATLEGARAVAVARADLPGELAAVKELSRRKPGDLSLLERQADLELTVGDPGAGLEIIQRLAAQHPKDPVLAEKLDAAKFRWRLSLLPKAVQEVAVKPTLDRAGFAVLLYWLVPSVRYARPSAGRIATDVLDHPHQEEIVRVLNLGLMDVDSTLHRFSPSAPMRRGAALRTLVRLLTSSGRAIPCLKSSPGQSSACATATACGLVSEGEDCDAGTSLSGLDAVELIRRTQKHLGGS
jgi:tetratricopeptide (TPR) repeat protein